MCGIVYAQSFDGLPVNNAILQQFDKQRGRGTDGFGVYDGEYLNMVHATKEDKILKWLVKYDSNILLLHHRWPTSTKNVKAAAHPFSTRKFFKKHEYILVHNGNVRNALDLFENHQELGIEYKSLLDDWTFNDSEALLWDFALYMEGKQSSMKSHGDMAFICLRKTKGKLTEMYFARNSGRPLHMNWTQNMLELSSEGVGDNIPIDTLYTWDYREESFDTKFLSLPEYTWSYNNACSPYPSSYTSYRDNDDVEPEDDYAYRQQDDYGNYFSVKTVPTPPALPAHVATEATVFGGESADSSPGIKSTLLRRWHELTDGVKERREEEALGRVAPPSKQTIELTALDYLASFRGHFEQAYWAAESDYDDTLQDIQAMPDSLALLQYKRLLEGVLEYLENDPENIDENSVSSMWEEVYNKDKRQIGFAV